MSTKTLNEGQQQGQQQEQQVQQEQEPQLIALPGWGDSPDAFSSTLRHPRSSLRFLLKVLPLSAQVLATAVPQPVEGGSSDPQKVATCEFVLADEVDAGGALLSVPLRAPVCMTQRFGFETVCEECIGRLAPDVLTVAVIVGKLC
jgi:hypothetical protein